MRNERKHYTAEEKVAILRRHLLDKVPVSDLCEELGLRPTVFYRWQKEFFENGSAAFQSKERPARQVEEKQKRIEFLEKKVQTKDEVLAELGESTVSHRSFTNKRKNRLVPNNTAIMRLRWSWPWLGPSTSTHPCGTTSLLRSPCVRYYISKRKPQRMPISISTRSRNR